MDSYLKQQLKLVGRALLTAAVFVAGMTLVLIGIVMIFTPGPAFILIPAGLALLATEFVWARRLLEQAKPYINRAVERAKAKKEAWEQRRRGTPPGEPPSPTTI